MKKRFLVTLIAMMILSALLMSCRQRNRHEGEVRIPGDPDDFIGMNYKEVQEEFEQSGFTNIRLKKVPPTEIDVPSEEGDVKKVTVDDMDDFTYRQWTWKTSEVVIRYISFSAATTEDDFMDMDDDMDDDF